MKVPNEKAIQAFYGELEKIANEYAMGAPQTGMMQDNAQSESETVPNDAAPAHGVIASRVQQLDPRRAVSVPVMEPPPGYVYNPDLVAFVPNEQDPGWLAQEAAVEAARNKGWFDAGQQATVEGQAQQQLDASVQQDVDAQAASQQQQAMSAQQQQAMQMEASRAAMLSAAREGGKRQARKATPGGSANSSVGPQGRAKKGKGVTIHVGR